MRGVAWNVPARKAPLELRRAGALIFSLLFVLAVTVGCITQATVETIPEIKYTQAAGTVFVQLTKAAALTPSATLTPTMAPTSTITLTAAPTLTFTPSPIPTEAWMRRGPGNVTAPILAYGTVGDGSKAYTDIPMDLFQQELDVLKKAGYQTVTVSQVASVVAQGGELPIHPAALTFDGMSAGIYKNAFPAMQKVGYIGTVYVIVNQLDQPGKLTTANLKDLLAAGWEIGSQGMTGYNLTGFPDKLNEEIAGSKQALEKSLEITIKTFAYPMGGVTDDIAAKVSRYGYLGAVGRIQSYVHVSSTIFYLGRLPMHSDQTIGQFTNVLPWRG